MVLEKGSILVMQGDSITDTGRARPVGEKNGELGSGYVQYVAAFLNAAYPELGIRVLNTGISGNTSRTLLERWQEDTLDLNPSWVSIMIGANDVWRQHDRPLATEHIVDDAEYRKNLEEIIQKTLPVTKNIVLLEPYYMGQGSEDQMRVSMVKYASIVKDIAAEYGLRFAPTQTLFDEYMKYWHPHSMSWDCIHPNHTGSMLIAKAFLNAVEFDWGRMK